METTTGCGRVMGQNEKCGDEWPDGLLLCNPCLEVKRLQDRLAAIERQVLWRTEDMPEGVAAWERDKEGTCIFWMRLECGVIPWATAPDYRPDEPGPIWLPILDPE